MNVQIDELQQEKFIEPIFKALINHADDATIINVYFDTNLSQYSEYIPDRIMSDPQFIKEAIKRHLIDYKRVPDSLKNTDFITREDYLHLVESRQVEINNGLYPQDKEIILKGIHGVDHEELIEPQFRNDLAFMAECIKVEPKVWYYLDKEAELLSEKQLVVDILTHNAELFYFVPAEQRKEKYILKAMLTTKEGYNLLNNFGTLRTITDPELVLDILKIKPDIRVIHQEFSNLIKKHGAKKDPYNFFKSYLMMNSLNKNLEKNDYQPKSVKI